MYLIDLTSTRRQAFARGLLRGLGAPVMIFSIHELPPEATPKFISVENPTRKSTGIRGDWQRVGHQLRESTKADISAHE